jgi:hypothetical protein
MIGKAQDHVNSGKKLTDDQKRDLFTHILSVTQSENLLTNEVPESLKSFGSGKIAVTETEKMLQEKAEISKSRKEAVREEREKLYGPLTPEESYMTGKDSDEKVEFYSEKFSDLSNEDAMKEIESLINKGVLSPSRKDRSRTVVRILERLQK